MGENIVFDENMNIVAKKPTLPLIPDVLPDASNICTLLIKLGDTIKKVC